MISMGALGSIAKPQAALPSSTEGALVLSVADAYVVAASNSLIPNASTYTIGYFHKVDTLPDGAGIAVGVDKSVAVNGNFSFAFINTSPTMQTYVTSGGSGVSHVSHSLTIGDWHSMIIRVTASTYRLWIDGVFEAEYTHTGPAPGGSGAIDASPFVIGDAPVFGNIRSTQKICAMGIWQGTSFSDANAAAYDAHIRAGYEGSAFAITPTTYWGMRVISGGQIDDDIGNVYPLTTVFANVSSADVPW